LEAIAQEHPAYGYLRTNRELREGYGYRIKHKVVQKLHQEWEVPLMRSTKPPKPSGIREVITAAVDRINLVAEKQEIEPFKITYADFTELAYADGHHKVYLMPIVDHANKMVLGWAVGDRAITELALQAWTMRERHCSTTA
jgi:transposase InsO family protein